MQLHQCHYSPSRRHPTILCCLEHLSHCSKILIQQMLQTTMEPAVLCLVKRMAASPCKLTSLDYRLMALSRKGSRNLTLVISTQRQTRSSMYIKGQASPGQVFATRSRALHQVTMTAK